jgi:hypothetical protein
VVRSVCGRMLMAFVSLVWASTSFRDPHRLSRQRTKLSAPGGDGVERGLRRFSPTGATLAVCGTRSLLKLADPDWLVVQAVVR